MRTTLVANPIPLGENSPSKGTTKLYNIFISLTIIIPWSRFLLEEPRKRQYAQIVKKFPAFYGT
jgi:hypothetical protein